MLEKLLFKHLTKKGVIGYFIGTIVLFSFWAYYVLGILGYSMDEGRSMFMGGALVLNLLWAIVCYFVWKKPSTEEEEKKTNE